MSRAVAAAVAAILALSAAPAAAHPPGVCLPAERCETWSATYNDPAVPADRESNQSVRAVLSNATTVFTVVSSVAFSSTQPTQSTATANVVAYDLATGAVRWTARQQQGWSNSPEHAALSPDGAILYVNGTSFDDNPFAQTDTHIATTAYATGTGTMLWSATWDGLPDSRDNAYGIAVAPDGSEVYVTGITSSPARYWDFVTVAYGADGRELWSRTFGEPGENDEPMGVAVSSDGGVLAVTGRTGGVGSLPDYTTVAYSLRGRGGRQLWTANYDGGAGRTDFANAVAADADRFYVTGSSDGGPAGYHYATVAYDVRTGAQAWTALWSDGRRGPGGATDIAAANGRIVVTGRSTDASEDDWSDAGTVAYDAATGRELWVAQFAPVRHDGFARGLALSTDGTTAYVVTTERPIHSILERRLGLVAYDVATGAERWHTFLDQAGGVLTGVGVAAGGGSVAVAGNLTRPGLRGIQDIEDALTAVFPE